MEFHATGTPDGMLQFAPYTRNAFKEFLRDNGPVRMTITPQLPESSKLRRFFHGAVLPLWAYLDGKNYRDKQLLVDLHEIAKLEFNGQIVVIGGAPKKVGRSTKGPMLGPFVERVITHLEENYGIDRARCLNPDDYKHFISTIFMHGKYDTYIDFLIEQGTLKANANA